MLSFQKIQVIINPAAGQDEPILNTLNQVFQEYGVEWQVAITRHSGDAQRLAEAAAAGGFDLVAGYGGDGTLMEIANGLQGSGIPLGVLPGGTGNSLARELNIPMGLAQAAELLCQAPNVRQIDLGQINDRYFLLHVYAGLKPSQQASRDLKDSLGIFAYLLPVLRVITDPQVTRYSLTIDGTEVEEEGIVCIIVNAPGLGINLPFIKSINPEDGLLDIILVKTAALSAVPKVLEGKMPDELFCHWRGREIALHADTAQEVWADGEAVGKTPFTAVAAPKALRVVTPPKEESGA
ncbi:MAG: diacylglycerol kinase family lipid kinase [Anaerolineae bacterium]